MRFLLLSCLFGLVACSPSEPNVPPSSKPKHFSAQLEGVILHMSGNTYSAGWDDPSRRDTISFLLDAEADSISHGDTLTFLRKVELVTPNGNEPKTDDTLWYGKLMLSADKSRIEWLLIGRDDHGAYHRAGFEGRWIAAFKAIPVINSAGTLSATLPLPSPSFDSLRVDYNSYQSLQTAKVYHSDSVLGFTPSARLSLTIK